MYWEDFYVIICVIFLIACSNNNPEKAGESDRLEIGGNKDNTIVSLPPKDNYGESFRISIDKSLLLDNIEKVCLYPRKFGTEGEQIALNYLKGKLEEYGYVTDIQSFPVYKQDLKSTHVKYCDDYFKENPYNSEVLGNGKNVIAKKNNYSNTKRTIYLTAHYDTTENTTGVIDNGTGVGVVLEVARQLRDYDSPFNIVIVFFSGEEYFRVGSRAFVSSLTNNEKEDIIGVINVDMIGEKDSEGVIAWANTGEHNILTLMINNQLGDPIPVLEGGYSDDLSFYLGKIPALTFTNKNPKPSRAKEKDQFQYIDFDELKNISHLITNFCVNFDIDVYERILKEKSFKSNRAMENKDLIDAFKAVKTDVVEGFQLANINASLLENGYDSKTEYIYKNREGKRYIVTEVFNVFIKTNYIGENALNIIM